MSFESDTRFIPFTNYEARASGHRISNAISIFEFRMWIVQLSFAIRRQPVVDVSTLFFNWIDAAGHFEYKLYDHWIQYDFMMNRLRTVLGSI